MTWKKWLKQLLGVNRKAFQQICLQNGIELEFATNVEALPILQEIFVQRAYADYFPFYQKATIVDVGAHFGYFSLFAARNLEPTARIIALEPSSKNVRQLSQNVHANTFSNIEISHAALSTSVGTQSLQLSQSENNTLLPLTDSALPTETVPTTTLAHLFDTHQLDQLDFLKLDCEGAEYDALYQTPAELFQTIKVISMEFHDLKKADYTALAMATFLQKQGFVIKKLQHSPTNFGRNYGKLLARRE